MKQVTTYLTGVERLLYGSLSAVQCLLWLLYGAVWIDKHRVIITEHRHPSCLHLTVTDLELRLHNTVSNSHSRIESVLALQFSGQYPLFSHTKVPSNLRPHGTTALLNVHNSPKMNHQLPPEVISTDTQVTCTTSQSPTASGD